MNEERTTSCRKKRETRGYSQVLSHLKKTFGAIISESGYLQVVLVESGDLESVQSWS
jgi:hypothetical protein